MTLTQGQLHLALSLLSVAIALAIAQLAQPGACVLI